MFYSVSQEHNEMQTGARNTNYSRIILRHYQHAFDIYMNCCYLKNLLHFFMNKICLDSKGRCGIIGNETNPNKRLIFLTAQAQFAENKYNKDTEHHGIFKWEGVKN